MRVTAVLAAIASCAVIFTVQSAKADALSPVDLVFKDSPSLLENIALNNEQNKEDSANKTQNEEVPEEYLVKQGDTLISIAKDYDTTWQRLFFKNKNISHPDQLDVDLKLVIPKPDENLEERELPQPVVVPVRQTYDPSRPATQEAAQPSTARSISRGSSSGNRYSYGYCTWYVKNRRPDLPNNLGNAITWVSRAAAQGLPTGSTPRVGAVGQSGNHVVYIEAVNGDGTVTVSEMNWGGWNTTNTRIASASSFRYIY